MATVAMAYAATAARAYRPSAARAASAALLLLTSYMPIRADLRLIFSSSSVSASGGVICMEGFVVNKTRGLCAVPAWYSGILGCAVALSHHGASHAQSAQPVGFAAVDSF